MKFKYDAALKSGITNLGQAVKSSPHVLFVGSQYLIEMNPSEFDDLPIYICTQPFCEVK